MYNAYERHSAPTIKQMQVAYLYNECNETYARIAEITGYAISTCRSYARNPYIKSLFFVVEVEEIPVEQTAKILNRVCGGVTVPMNYLQDCGEDVERQQTVYLFKFYDNDKTVPIFSKIGTTSVSVNTRLRQEIGEYRKKGFDVRSVDVCRIRDCGDFPPEAFESFLRALLIKKYPNTWHKNDRFFNVDVSTDYFDTLCNQFVNII